jgi:hypothetical protein
MQYSNSSNTRRGGLCVCVCVCANKTYTRVYIFSTAFSYTFLLFIVRFYVSAIKKY